MWFKVGGGGRKKRRLQPRGTTWGAQGWVSDYLLYRGGSSVQITVPITQMTKMAYLAYCSSSNTSLPFSFPPPCWRARERGTPISTKYSLCTVLLSTGRASSDVWRRLFHGLHHSRTLPKPCTYLFLAVCPALSPRKGPSHSTPL